MSLGNPVFKNFWELSGTSIQLKVARDVDFQGKKAIDMAFDSGATVPVSPTDNMMFVHTPTGREVLLRYSATDAEWKPLFSFGTATIHVDPTGTDNINNGGVVGTGAFKTWQFALDTVKLLGGAEDSVTINGADGTYTENLSHPKINFATGRLDLAGNMSAVLSTTATGGVAPVYGGSAALGYAEDTGAAYTVDEFKHKILHITSGTYSGQKAPISSNTATRILHNSQLIGNLGTDTFEVLDFDVEISGNMSIEAGAKVQFTELNLSSSSGSVMDFNLIPNLDIIITRCILDPAVRTRFTDASFIQFQQSIMKGGTQWALRLERSAKVSSRGSNNIFHRAAGNTSIILQLTGSLITMNTGDHVYSDDVTPGATFKGLDAQMSRAEPVRCTFENLGIGMNAIIDASINNTLVGFINVTTNEFPSGASDPSYIGT